MPGFIRRVGSYPGLDYITQIEGVVIVDAPPPGSVDGVGTGVACLVGEFADMTYATTVDSSGNVTTKSQPVELFGSGDLAAKVGGFDETIGEFGVSGGNGYAALRSKKFSRLVVVPVNLCSSKGARFFRDLPLCRTTTDPNPVVPVLAASVAAGREFRNGSGRVRVGRRVEFTARAPIASGVGGSFANTASAATQTFTGPSDWTLYPRPDGTLGIRKGDVVVVGNNNGGAKQPTAEAGTYRVASDPASGTSLTIERLDGANFAVTTQSTIPWRVHFSTDADSSPERVPGSAAPGGYAAGDAGGYVVAVRPLTNAAGANTDGNWTTGTLLTPREVPSATTGSSWDPLGGLGGRTMVGSNTPFTAAIQGVNPASSASIDALYATAFDALLSDALPTREVNIVWAARTSSTIRAKLKTHVLQASGQGVGRVACTSPEVNQLTLATVLGDTDPGVGANRDERVFYAWPGVRTYVPEAVGFILRTADGLTTADGMLDGRSDGWLAAVLSNLAPERNPGQAAAPVPEVMSPIAALSRGAPDLGIGEYIQLRDKGIAGPRIDRTAGPIFQSGVTTSLTSGQKNINRRRMADYIEDSLAQRLVQFSKLPATTQMKDGAVGEVDAFLNDLLSPSNPAAQRINAYQVDDQSGNTPTSLARGVFVIIVRVQTTPTADFIVLQAEIGEGVVINQVA